MSYLRQICCVDILLHIFAVKVQKSFTTSISLCRRQHFYSAAVNDTYSTRIKDGYSIFWCIPQVWDNLGRLLYQSAAQENSVTSVAWCPSSDMFAVGSYNSLMLCDRNGWMYTKVGRAALTLNNRDCHTDFNMADMTMRQALYRLVPDQSA